MAKYKLTNKAVEDLSKIWDYTFEVWSERQADKYYKSLISNCQEIADNPHLGKNYSEINQSLLGMKMNRHIIFYRILNKVLPMGRGVNIIREASFDTNWSNLFWNLGFLLMFLFIVPFAVYINQRRTIRIYLKEGITLPKAMQTKLAMSVERLYRKHKNWKRGKNG